MKNSVFIAAPISGFSSDREYYDFRNLALKLIDFLRLNGYMVFSEMDNISDSEDYDSPGKSVEIDFNNIEENEYFILLHPAKMQTSSLIEFGYACAYKKKIIAVGRKDNFPYLVIGYAELCDNAKIIEINELNNSNFPRILAAMKELENKE